MSDRSDALQSGLKKIAADLAAPARCPTRHRLRSIKREDEEFSGIADHRLSNRIGAEAISA
jgi:hypothetical protein